MYIYHVFAILLNVCVNQTIKILLDLKKNNVLNKKNFRFQILVESNLTAVRRTGPRENSRRHFLVRFRRFSELYGAN